MCMPSWLNCLQDPVFHKLFKILRRDFIHDEFEKTTDSFHAEPSLCHPSLAPALYRWHAAMAIPPWSALCCRADCLEVHQENGAEFVSDDIEGQLVSI